VSLVEGHMSFFKATVSSVLSISRWSPRYRIGCRWYSCSLCSWHCCTATDNTL